MVAPASRRPKHSFSEYVRLADESNVRLEFSDGEIYAMAGGTPEHAEIASNVIALLKVQLATKRCRVPGSDVRIRVPATGLASYPDVSVVCGEIRVDPEDDKTVTNPVVIVEVLSPTTEGYDRGEKLTHYKRLDTLRDIVLIDHDRERVELWSRPEHGEWTRTEAGPDGTVELRSIGCALSVEDLYRDAFGGSLARPSTRSARGS